MKLLDNILRIAFAIFLLTLIFWPLIWGFTKFLIALKYLFS